MKPALDLQAELDRLDGLTLFELRNEWRRLYRMAPPMRLSRDLTLRGLAYRLQEREQGGLARSMLARLAQMAEPAGGTGLTVTMGKRAFVMPKPGTRLIRQWRGVTHAVLVHTDNFEWQGERYRSLSVIARTITGAHWSGPRFFGLRRARVQETKEDGPARIVARTAAKTAAKTAVQARSERAPAKTAVQAIAMVNAEMGNDERA